MRPSDLQLFADMGFPRTAERIQTRINEQAKTLQKQQQEIKDLKYQLSIVSTNKAGAVT